ncbi:class II aldolase [Sphingomonas oleivorans]|uniref:Class II aldolase n=1 Tax=Sphingomonas oleivorans TaxID=1735121 RepID=A0A2T5G288_9SPHN|nr:class II aldolase/adducin family protein [Sphingomonas oleivorans]PTQ13254.1 class II aldolase [Sphingomonas oleivorans]
MPSLAQVRTQPADLAAAEREARVQLAQFYHLVDYLGWTELIFNHISLRVPGPEHHYLVNPFGLHYSEITPDNLLKVDVTGHLVEPSDYPANPAGFALHGAIHETRADVACVAHTHTNPVSAIAMKVGGFDHDNFYGAQLFGRVGYHDFEGITLYPDERSRMIASLGDKHVLVLRNHGVAVCERDVPTTFMLLWTVQRAAEIQCQAGMIPGPDIALADMIRQRCSDAAASLIEKASFADLVYGAMVRKMQRERGIPWEKA